MGLVIGALVVLGAVAAFAGTRRAAHGVAPTSEPSLRRQLAVVRANRGFRRLLVVVGVQGAATGALLAGAVYVAQHVLGDPTATTALLVAFTLPAVVALPVLLRVAARADKRRGVLLSSAVFVVAILAWPAAPAVGPVLVLGLTAVVGFANAVQDAFVLAMLPDRIAEDTARTARRQAGVFAGVFSGVQGLGFALGPLLFGLVLQVAGYVPSDTGVAAAQSASTVAAVLVAFAVLPAALTALSLLALRRPR
jgi:Na+/melibiose symporter-like transporter